MPPPSPLRIRRFTVMAVLQAARAHALGLAEPAAFSWGLNRAIFYAAAKRGFRSHGGGAEEAGAADRSDAAVYRLGDDFAYRAEGEPELRFTIGGETQTPERFGRQVSARFGPAANFRSAWEEAGRIVRQFDEAILRSGSRFYSEVYRPRRDELASRWEAEFGASRSVAERPPPPGRPKPRGRSKPGPGGS